MKWDVNDKQAVSYWEDFRTQIFNTTTIDMNETEEQKADRMKRLEKKGNEEEWFKYYFPKFYSNAPAKFQIKSSVKFIYTSRIRQSRKWARGLAKSTRRMMEVFYLMFVKKFPTNLLLCSRTYDNAERLLMPYMLSLEANQRIINDYGVQERPGRWQKGEFITRANASFRAIGRGQNPSGARLDEMRITVILYDDIDDQDALRNDDITEQDWEWMEKNVLPTVDIANDYRIACDNNIKGEDSLAARFAKYANDQSEVDLEDSHGKSTWPEKNSLKDIADIKGSMSWESYQAEYMNNPIRKGITFKEITWGKCPLMNQLKFILVYSDPATSNKDKPVQSSKLSGSYKVVSLIGYHDDKYYLYKCFNDVTTNDTFIEWLYAMRKHVKGAAPLYIFIENNTLQDPFYEQVFLPIIYAKGKEHGGALQVTPDDTKKPEKWFRIEATLEPLVRMGRLIFNIDEKDNPHMQRMEKQFLTARPQSRTLDGPDSVQGAVQMIQNKIIIIDPKAIKIYKQPANAKKY